MSAARIHRSASVGEATDRQLHATSSGSKSDCPNVGGSTAEGPFHLHPNFDIPTARLGFERQAGE